MSWLNRKPSGVYLCDRPNVCIPLGKISDKEAEREWHRYEAKKDDEKTFTDELGEPLAAVYDRYLKFLEAPPNPRKPNTMDSVRAYVGPFVAAHGRTLELVPTKKHNPIKAWKETLEAKTYRGKPYSVDTVAVRLRHIKAFCSWMTEEERIYPVSPFQITIPEGRKDAGRALLGHEVRKLFKVWPKPRMHKGRLSKHALSKLFFQLIYYAGPRSVELLGDWRQLEHYPGLSYEDIDRSNSFMKIHHTKNADPREAALPLWLAQAIPLGQGPIFRGQISRRVLRNHYAEAKALAGITGRCRIHDGRVTCATEWARRNRDAKSSMDQFGWKSEKMALLYNKVATNLRIKQAQNITYK